MELSLDEYRLGKAYNSWEENTAKTVTFIVTQDCQLVCKYCYLVGKNNNSKMTFEIAQKTIDYLLTDRETFSEPSVIWEFMGGEPFLEIDLIDKISDYIKLRMYETNHPWFNSYRFSFSTNGLLYGSPKVQRYIKKNHSHLSIGISIDGTKEKHNSQRIFPGGEGSYDNVVQNIPLWLQQFPNAGTKATISHDDLPCLKESVVHLWELGIKDININTVFEDVWQDGDDQLFESQLKQIADYIIDNRLYITHNLTLFSEYIGNPLDPAYDNQNWCGAGQMLAVDHTGTFYPCPRFAPYALNKAKPRVIGNCYTGIDQNKLRPFLALDRLSQSLPECIDCEVASGCAWCQGLNLDASDTETIYQRATFICRMHKARVRANRYYWDKLNCNSK